MSGAPALRAQHRSLWSVSALPCALSRAHALFEQRRMRLRMCALPFRVWVITGGVNGCCDAAE